MNILIKVKSKQNKNNFRWITPSGGTVVNPSFELNISGKTPDEIISKGIFFFKGELEQKVELITESEAAKENFEKMWNNILYSFSNYPSLMSNHESGYFVFSAESVTNYDFNL